MTVWGQYIDHDMDLTPQSKAITTFQGNVRCENTCQNLNPCFPIQLPLNDPKRAAGRACLPFFRSVIRVLLVSFFFVQSTLTSKITRLVSAAICGTGMTSSLVSGDLKREQFNAVTSYIDGSTVYGSTPEVFPWVLKF